MGYETRTSSAGCPAHGKGEPKLREIRLLSHRLSTAVLCPAWRTSAESYGLTVTLLNRSSGATTNLGHSGDSALLQRMERAHRDRVLRSQNAVKRALSVQGCRSTHRPVVDLPEEKVANFCQVPE